MAPPMFQEMKFNFNIDNGERGRQAGKMDINAELKRSGCGPFQIVYVMGLLATWCITGFVAYSDKFMVGEPEVQSAQERGTLLKNPNMTKYDYTDMLEDLGLLQLGYNTTLKMDAFSQTCNMTKSDQATDVPKTDNEGATTTDENGETVMFTCDELISTTSNGMRKQISACLKYIQYIAWGVGIFCFGISDKIGLKPTLMGSLVMCSVAYALWALTGVLGLTGTTALIWIYVCKAIAFFAIGFIQFAGIYWPEEMLSPRNKTIMNLLPNIMWVLGALCASWQWSFLRNWNTMLWVMAAVPAIFTSIWALVDSPTTMYSRSRFSIMWASLTGKTPELLTEQKRVSDAEMVFQEMRLANGVTDKSIGDDDLELEQDDADGEVADPDVELDAAFIKNLLICMVTWFAAAVGFWGVSNESTVEINTYEGHFMGQTMALPGYMMSWALAAFIPDRRFTLSFSAFGIAALLGGASFAFKNGDIDLAKSLNFSAQLFCASLFGLVFVICPPIFNGKNKNMAAGILGATARLGCVFSAYGSYESKSWSKKPFMNFLCGAMDDAQVNRTDALGHPVGVFKSDGVTPLRLQDLTDNATVEFLFALPAAVACVLVWFIPSGAGSWTWQKGYTDFKGMLGNLFSGGSSGSMFKGNWSYFLSGNRAITMVSFGLLYAFYLAGTGWAVKDYIGQVKVTAAINAAISEMQAKLLNSTANATSN